MKTSIGKRGFSILKDELDTYTICDIKKDLTVKAFVNGDYGVKPTPFPVYCESNQKFYLPRYYGQKSLDYHQNLN